MSPLEQAGGRWIRQRNAGRRLGRANAVLGGLRRSGDPVSLSQLGPPGRVTRVVPEQLALDRNNFRRDVPAGAQVADAPLVIAQARCQLLVGPLPAGRVRIAGWPRSPGQMPIEKPGEAPSSTLVR